MSALRRTSALVLIFLHSFAPASLPAQQERKSGDATASISGRITIGEDPAAGVAVALISSENFSFQQAPVARTRTDEQGYYRLTGLHAGRYIVSPLAPPYVAPTEIGQRWPGKSITLQEGESVESVNIELRRGGVITGRVTDADGRPLIGVRVRIAYHGQRSMPLMLQFSSMYETDDRGIYRVYGVPEGRYTVSVGEDTNMPGARVGFGGDYYQRTFHPDATEESRASVVEIKPGSEATGIDIRVGRPAKSFAASGRVIDARTGQPVVGATCGYSPVSADGRQMQSYAMGYRTDAAGNFKIEGMMPGRYAAFATIESDSDAYSEPVIFEVANEDVRGLELRLVPGSSISGVVVVEGTDDPSVLSRVSELRIYLGRMQTGEFAPPTMASQIAPDGTFRLGGLKPGKFTLQITSFPVQKGFVLTRVERNGVEQYGPIEIAAGEHITGLRAVISYGSSVVRGQVVVEGGSLPQGMRLMVSIRRQAAGAQESPRPATADDRGRFVIDGLIAGDYELTVTAWRPSPPGQMSQWEPVRQAVTVGHQTETEVTINFKLKERTKDN